jgi:hypothetical protein
MLAVLFDGRRLPPFNNPTQFQEVHNPLEIAGFFVIVCLPQVLERIPVSWSAWWSGVKRDTFPNRQAIKTAGPYFLRHQQDISLGHFPIWHLSSRTDKMSLL